MLRKTRNTKLLIFDVYNPNFKIKNILFVCDISVHGSMETPKIIPKIIYLAQALPLITGVFFPQAVDDVGRGHVKPTDRLYELKALQEQEKKDEVRLHSEQPGGQLLNYGTDI